MKPGPVRQAGVDPLSENCRLCVADGDVRYDGSALINLSPIDPESDRAGYRQIADQIRSAIHEGRLVPGEQLRSEAKMRKEAGVSRGTLRDGLLLLKGEGLLVPRQGKGWFVQGS